MAGRGAPLIAVARIHLALAAHGRTWEPLFRRLGAQSRPQWPITYAKQRAAVMLPTASVRKMSSTSERMQRLQFEEVEVDLVRPGMITAVSSRFDPSRSVQLCCLTCGKDTNHGWHGWQNPGWRANRVQTQTSRCGRGCGLQTEDPVWWDETAH